MSAILIPRRSGRRAVPGVDGYYYRNNFAYADGAVPASGNDEVGSAWFAAAGGSWSNGNLSFNGSGNYGYNWADRWGVRPIRWRVSFLGRRGSTSGPLTMTFFSGTHSMYLYGAGNMALRGNFITGSDQQIADWGTHGLVGSWNTHRLDITNSWDIAYYFNGSLRGTYTVPTGTSRDRLAGPGSLYFSANGSGNARYDTFFVVDQLFVP